MSGAVSAKGRPRARGPVAMVVTPDIKRGTSFGRILAYAVVPAACIAAFVAGMPAFGPSDQKSAIAERPNTIIPQPAAIASINAEPVIGELRLTTPSTEFEQTHSGFDLSLAWSDANERRADVIANHQRIAGLFGIANRQGIDTRSIIARAAQIVDRPAAGKPRPINAASAHSGIMAFTASNGPDTRVFDAIDSSPQLANGMRSRLRQLDDQISQLEAEQTALLDALEYEIEQRARTLVAVPNALGLRLPVAGPDDVETGIGGPLVPLGAQYEIEPIDLHIARVDALLSYAVHLHGFVESLPVRSPLAGPATISSRFGPRRDPFTGRLARHGGLDFRAARGTMVRATAAGTVTRAGRLGGYGKLVEIDHGNGLKTRYAHLSRITVDVGDRISAGTLIGKVGSTGRSTGPHLHYEVRASGIARDPERYLDAGAPLRG